MNNMKKCPRFSQFVNFSLLINIILVVPVEQCCLRISFAEIDFPDVQCYFSSRFYFSVLINNIIYNKV